LKIFYSKIILFRLIPTILSKKFTFAPNFGLNNDFFIQLKGNLVKFQSCSRNCILSFALQNALDFFFVTGENWEGLSKDESQETCLIQNIMLNFRDRSFHTILYALVSRLIKFK